MEIKKVRKKETNETNLLADRLECHTGEAI